MKKFLSESKLQVVEERVFKDRVMEKLGWSSDQWWNRFKGRTAITEAERLVMCQTIAEIRNEVSDGQLDLSIYNNKE